MSASWRSATEQEYPQYVHLIPHPGDIELSNIDNGGVMTDICNSAHKGIRLIAASVIGFVHSMFCHNHIRNVWLINVLDSLTEFLRAHINYSLDKVSPQFRVYPVLVSLACSFDKKSSLCANYPKGLGEAFCQWMMDNHSDELLFHVDRSASGGR